MSVPIILLNAGPAVVAEKVELVTGIAKYVAGGGEFSVQFVSGKSITISDPSLEEIKRIRNEFLDQLARSLS